jgi:hypothetical protein
MKIAPDGVRGKLRRIGSIKSPIGTTEKIAALSYFHSSFQDFILYGLPFFPGFHPGLFSVIPPG